jgi:two-component system sensor histidine kinase VicK
MSWYHIKSFLSFILIALLVAGLVITNYFKAEVLAYISFYIPNILPEALLIFSIVIIFSFFLFFWRKQIENERSRQEFVSVITHKFRTPLTGVKWAIEMLRNNITEQQKQDILAHMENSNQRLMEIVDLMIGFAQFDKHLEYAYEATSLREIVDSSLQKYGDQIRAKNINFEINSASALPMVVTDKRKIQFVIDMLIDNAIKYTPSGGIITISISQENKSLIFSIHDTGIGISWMDRGHVFKRFYRSSNAKLAHTEGMGLGLYTAKAIVKKHHGRIWFDSKGVGKGTTFFVALKIAS